LVDQVVAVVGEDRQLETTLLALREVQVKVTQVELELETVAVLARLAAAVVAQEQ
jgi:hypothetical protein